jgi:hypothetical protein
MIQEWSEMRSRLLKRVLEVGNDSWELKLAEIGWEWLLCNENTS